MPLNVQLVNAQVKDPQSGQMTPAGLIGSDALSTINQAKNQAIAAVQQKGEETLQSIPDDYTALSNEVADVKTQLKDDEKAIFEAVNLWDGNYMAGVRTVNFTNLRYYPGGTSSYFTAKIPVEPNTAYTIIRSGSSYLCALTSSENLDSVSSEEYTPDDSVNVAKAGAELPKYFNFTTDANAAYLYVCYTITGETVELAVYKGTYTDFAKTNFYNRSETYNKTEIDVKTSALENSIDELDNTVDDFVMPNVFTKKTNIIADNYVQNKTISSDGTLIDAGSTTYYVTDKISVNVGETFLYSAKMRFNNIIIGFYATNDTLLSSVKAGDIATAVSSTFTWTDYEFTIPENCSYIRLGFYVFEYNLTKLDGSYISSHPSWIDKKWACIGDSLTAINTTTTKHYFDYIAEESGIIPINLGANGTGYAKSSAGGAAFYDRIASVPVDSDVVTIFGSFNDLTSGLEIGTMDDSNTTTIAGCINTTISNLQSRIPLVKLGIVAPTPWDTTRPNFSDESNSYKYYTILKTICERRSIPFLDLWYHSNLHPWDATFRAVAYTHDGGSGTHPDENGHAIIAPRFKAFLETLLM